MSGLSVRAKLTLWNVSAVALIVLGLGVGVSWRVRSDLLQGVDRELRLRADRFSQAGFPTGGAAMPGMMSPSEGMPTGAPDGPPMFGQQPTPNGRPGIDGEPRFQGNGPSSIPGPPNNRPGENRPSPAPPYPGQGRAPVPGPGAQRPGQQMVPNPGDPAMVPPMSRGPDQREIFNPMRPRVFDSKGKSASWATNDVPWDPNALKTGIDGKESYSMVTLGSDEFRVYTRPLRPESPGRVVQFANPMSETYRAADGVSRTLLALAPLALLIAAAGGYLVTQRALKPVGDIQQAAEKINAENLSGRLATKGNDEFAQLGNTVNAMLDRLEGSFRNLEAAVENQRRFTADASHELRTPLAAIKANSSLALSAERTPEEYKQTIESIDKSASRMSALVQDLLLLARTDAGKLDLEKARVDLCEIASDVANMFRGSGPEIELQLTDLPANVVGSESALFRLLENLTSNAVRHTTASGKVTLSLQRLSSTQRDSASSAGRSAPFGYIELRVADTGEGIAPEHLSRLGERFYRADASRSRTEGGAGLGIAICRSIVEAHHGTIEFESELGKGTTVRVLLPQAE